jgi:hypothetical protein
MENKVIRAKFKKNIAMNILIQSFELFDSEYYSTKYLSRAIVLVSATAVGNDGRSCPLFHSSLVPKVVQAMDFGEREFAPFLFCTKLVSLLIGSHNITWLPKLMLGFVDGDSDPTQPIPPSDIAIMHTLQSTRYSSRSLRELRIMGLLQDEHIPFIQNHCSHLEVFHYQNEIFASTKCEFDILPVLQNAPFLRELRVSNVELKFSCTTCQPVIFRHLTSFEASTCEITDEEFLNFAHFPNLERLSLSNISKLTGKSFEQVFKRLKKLRFVIFEQSKSLTDVSAVEFLSDTLEELVIQQSVDVTIKSPGRCWKTFPFLTKLHVCDIPWEVLNDLDLPVLRDLELRHFRGSEEAIWWMQKCSLTCEKLTVTDITTTHEFWCALYDMEALDSLQLNNMFTEGGDNLPSSSCPFKSAATLSEVRLEFCSDSVIDHVLRALKSCTNIDLLQMELHNNFDKLLPFQNSLRHLLLSSYANESSLLFDFLATQDDVSFPNVEHLRLICWSFSNERLALISRIFPNVIDLTLIPASGDPNTLGKPAIEAVKTMKYLKEFLLAASEPFCQQLKNTLFKCSRDVFVLSHDPRRKTFLIEPSDNLTASEKESGSRRERD